MWGMATRLNTAAVAVLAPETAANPAVAKTLATASPPGTQPTQARARVEQARGVSPAWYATKPMRMNIGRTLST